MQEKHVLVTGSSGGGKSTYLRMIQDSHDGVSIWISYGGEVNRKVPGEIVRSRREIESRIAECRSIEEVRNLRFQYVAEENGPEAAEVPVAVAKRIGQYWDGEVCTAVIADEAAPLLPDDDDESARENNPLAWAFHEGRDLNIKAVVCSQNPQELSYSPLWNLKWFVWVGVSKTFTVHFKQSWGLSDLDLPEEPHRYVVVRPVDPPEIVHRGETDPDLA